MKFSTRVDTGIDAASLFAAISDFPKIERMLVRRGVKVVRIDPEQDPGTGIGWQIGFDWRGKERNLRMDVTRFDRPERLTITGVSDPLDLLVDMSVVSLSRERARLIFETEIRPRNMRARLMLQTAKLGKSQIDQRFERRVREFVNDIIR